MNPNPVLYGNAALLQRLSELYFISVNNLRREDLPDGSTITVYTNNKHQVRVIETDQNGNSLKFLLHSKSADIIKVSRFCPDQNPIETDIYSTQDNVGNLIEMEPLVAAVLERLIQNNSIGSCMGIKIFSDGRIVAGGDRPPFRYASNQFYFQPKRPGIHGSKMYLG